MTAIELKPIAAPDPSGTNMDQDRLADLIVLSGAEGVGWSRYKALMESFGNEAAALNAPESALLRARGIGPKTAASISQARANIDARKEIEEARAEGISLIPCFDPLYPARLAEIASPPLILYVLGNPLALGFPSLGIVGTRRSTFYGQKQARVFASDLSSLGFSIVSGLARGVDTEAHCAALDAGGMTVAVLGSGLLNVYPPENAGLARRIASRGAVVSEFALRTSPEKFNFPRRNRIISGLSLGVLVIEASLRSGALLTARWAIEQDREVFALPGRIDSPQSAGTNALISRGAKLVSCASDIVSELPPSDLPEAALQGASRIAPDPAGLSLDEKSALAGIGQDPSSIEDLAEATGMPPERLSAALFFLEMKRFVRQLPGKMFARGF